MVDRYECIQEPADSWLVWDLLGDEPAVTESRLLMGLTAAEAHWMCVSLNNGRQAGADACRRASGNCFEGG